jgi:hypothetical protein
MAFSNGQRSEIDLLLLAAEQSIQPGSLQEGFINILNVKGFRNYHVSTAGYTAISSEPCPFWVLNWCTSGEYCDNFPLSRAVDDFPVEIGLFLTRRVLRIDTLRGYGQSRF